MFVDEVIQRGIQICRFLPGGRWGVGGHISVSETKGGVGGSFSIEESSLEEGTYTCKGQGHQCFSQENSRLRGVIHWEAWRWRFTFGKYDQARRFWQP